MTNSAHDIRMTHANCLVSRFQMQCFKMSKQPYWVRLHLVVFWATISCFIFVRLALSAISTSAHIDTNSDSHSIPSLESSKVSLRTLHSQTFTPLYPKHHMSLPRIFNSNLIHSLPKPHIIFWPLVTTALQPADCQTHVAVIHLSWPIP